MPCHRRPGCQWRNKHAREHKKRHHAGVALPADLSQPGCDRPGCAGRRHRRGVAAGTAYHCDRCPLAQRADNVTGALLFTNAGFEQVLEGPREVVERTFERIVADRRHADVTVLSFTPTPRRSFPDWPMAFCGQSVLAHLPDGGMFAGSRATTGSDVLRLLEQIVQQEDVWIEVYTDMFRGAQSRPRKSSTRSVTCFLG